MSEPDPAPEAPAEPQPAPSEAELLRRQLDEVTAKLRMVSKAYQDQQAETKSFRERFEAAAKQRAERQGMELVRGFFDPVMNLKRSITTEGSDMDTLVGGLKMVHQQFMQALEKLGLEPVPGAGESFDPAWHEALGTVEVTDRELDGKIMHVHSDGFHVKGQVLQPARVTVGRFVEPVGEA